MKKKKKSLFEDFTSAGNGGALTVRTHKHYSSPSTAQDEGMLYGLWGKAIFSTLEKGQFPPPPTWYGWLDHEEMLSERGDVTGIMAALSASLWQTWSCLVHGDPPAGTERCTDRLSPLSPLLISEHIGEASSLSLLFAMIAGTSLVNSECSPCLWNP